FRDERRQTRRRAERMGRTVSVRAKAADQSIAADALDRALAGCIDIRDRNDIGIVETGAEILEQIMQAREAMRLMDGNDIALCRPARGFQYRRDLDRVMAVIIDQRHLVPCAEAGKAPVHTTESTETLAD